MKVDRCRINETLMDAALKQQEERHLDAAMDRRLSGLQVQEAHIQQVLQQAAPRPRRPRWKALALGFALVALLGTALAAGLPATIAWIQSFYGQEKAEDLKKGTLMPVHQVRVLGQVQYEWLDTIHLGDTGKDEFLTDSNMLYGSLKITPAKGANIILMPEDYSITDPFGYNLFLGEQAPQGAPSFLDLAKERDAKIILAKAVPHGILVDGVLQEGWEIGYSYRSYPDGSLSYHFEIPMVKTQEEYTIRMRLNNWEITREGVWLREGDSNTWLKEDWELTLRPPEKK